MHGQIAMYMLVKMLLLLVTQLQVMVEESIYSTTAV